MSNGILADRQVIDASAAAARLGVSVGMVYKLLRLGRLEGYGVGRRRLIYADSIDSYRLRNAFGKAGPVPGGQEPAPAKPRRSEAAVKPLVLPAKRYLH